MTTIAEIKRAGGNQIRISISEYKGQKRCDIRQWFHDGEDYRPSPRGVSLSADELSQASDAFKLAAQLLK